MWDSKFILQLVALTAINGLAVIYDSTYIMMAVGVDAVVLGITTHAIIHG